MTVTLKIDNFTSLNIKESTTLAADVAPAATSLTLVNNNNIVADDYILVGRRGSETGEIRSVASASGATLVTTDAMTLRHDTYEDVTALFGNQIKVYRAPNVNGTTPADVTFTALGSPVAIDPDQLFTQFTDPDGGSQYWYKFTYYNQTSLAETSLADSGASRGGGIGIYASIDDVRSAAGFERNRNISDGYIAPFRQSAQDQINAKLAGVYVVPFTAPVNGYISQITKQLAAGHLKLDQLGQSNSEGQSMIKWAETQLESIRSGELSLTDAAGNPLPQPGGGGSVPGGGMGMSGYPNDAEQDGGFKFRADDRY